MSESQDYEFLALNRPLTTAEQAEVPRLTTQATITASSFTNEYHWGEFKGSPDELMQRYYDAHLYFATWGTRRVMFRLPRTLLDPGLAEQYRVDPQVTVAATPDHLFLDMTSEDEPGYWEEDLEGSLSALASTRSELAAGDLRPLYPAWLSGYGTWERDEDAFDDEDEDVVEPPVPAGLGSLTASQHALADFLRADADLLDVAAETSPALPRAGKDAGALAAHIAAISVGEKDQLLGLVATTRRRRPAENCCGVSAGKPGDEQVPVAAVGGRTPRHRMGAPPGARAKHASQRAADRKRT